MDRWINALSVVDRNRSRWREHFYKNPAAFRKRSSRAQTYLRSQQNRIDLCLQIGALFDSTGEDVTIPMIIYSDYTSVLSSRRPEGGRSPFETFELAEWVNEESKALHRARFVCARSELVRNSLIHDYNFPSEKIAVVGGGVNFSTLPEFRHKNIYQEPVALFIGKEFHRKGGDLLLEAFQIVRNHRPSARLTIVTTDSIPEGSPTQNVTVIREKCSRERISRLYHESHFFILPSRLETWGDVLLEAMAHALPCIGVRTDAMQEIIDDDATGFVVPGGDVRALAQRMLHLFNSPQIRHQMGIAARKKVESGFLWEHVVDRLSPVFESVMPVTL